MGSAVSGRRCRATPATTGSATGCCQAMRRRSMRTPPIVRVRHGGKPARFGLGRALRKGCRGHPLSEADKERAAGTAAVRSGAERVFAVYKRCYGLGRTRFPGLAKNTTFYGLAAIAPDIRKGAMFLRLYGLAQPATEG